MKMLVRSCSLHCGIKKAGSVSHSIQSKGLVERELEWIFCMWCLAHRHELAIKDALRGTSFDLLDEILLCLYNLYVKSPKKCTELESIVTDLKGAFKLNEGGVRPIRACGTRLVCHKLSAMRRVLSKYGAYTAHPATLSEDSSVNRSHQIRRVPEEVG